MVINISLIELLYINIGVFGLLLSIYLMSFKRTKFSNYFLGALVFLYSFDMISMNLLYKIFDDPFKIYELLIPTYFLYGPFLFLYVKTLTNACVHSNYFRHTLIRYV